MKIKKGFYIHKIFNESLIMADGVENINFNSIISLNETALFLWQKIEGREFCVEDMVSALLEEYDVDEKTAREDCETLLNQWIEAGVIDK